MTGQSLTLLLTVSSISPSPVPGSFITSVGKPNSVMEAAISVGVTSCGLYLTSALAASKAIRTLSTPA